MIFIITFSSKLFVNSKLKSARSLKKKIQLMEKDIYSICISKNEFDILEIINSSYLKKGADYFVIGASKTHDDAIDTVRFIIEQAIKHDTVDIKSNIVKMSKEN